MPTPTKITRYVLRAWGQDKLEEAMTFYESNGSAASPAPSLPSLAKALESGRLYVIEPAMGGAPVAASAVFDFAPQGYRTYVGELSGTCVTRPLNGCRPLGVQRLLLAVRLAVFATYASEPAEGESNTLISIVKDDNMASLRNIQAAGLVPAPENPRWMAYEHRSWTGEDGDGWTYFMATADTIRRAARDLDELGLSTGCFHFRREDRTDGSEEAIEILNGLPDMDTVDAVLREIAAGRQDVPLTAPPAHLIR